MKRTKQYLAAAGCLCLGLAAVFSPASGAESSGEPLFAGDMGPAEVDVSKYPPELQKIYRTALKRCSKCHSLARPLNAVFLELSKEDIVKLKKKAGKDAENGAVLQVGETIWKRYVKRMMRKPGAGIKKKDGKKIWQFLSVDSKERKFGEEGEKSPDWVKHRKMLLKSFQKENPKKYEELYGEKDKK